MDEVFERVLVDVDGRASSFSMGKLAILWHIDRKTGKFVAAHDPGYQTLIDVDSTTGRASYRPNTVPKEGVEFRFCPSTGGFKSLRSMAYHPATQAFYIPLNLTCEDGTFGPMKLVEGGGGSGPVRRINLMHPESPDGLGELLAMDVHGKILWRHRTRTPPNTSALTMGDGLVLEGYWDRYFRIHDAASGKILYTSPRMPTLVQGFPDHVCRQRQAVHRGARGHGRRVLVEQHRHGHDSRSADSSGDELDLCIRAAVATLRFSASLSVHPLESRSEKLVSREVCFFRRKLLELPSICAHDYAHFTSVIARGRRFLTSGVTRGLDVLTFSAFFLRRGRCED
jgi:hypothetical protein